MNNWIKNYIKKYLFDGYYLIDDIFLTGTNKSIFQSANFSIETKYIYLYINQCLNSSQTLNWEMFFTSTLFFFPSFLFLKKKKCVVNFESFNRCLCLTCSFFIIYSFLITIKHGGLWNDVVQANPHPYLLHHCKSGTELHVIHNMHEPHPHPNLHVLHSFFFKLIFIFRFFFLI